MDWWQVIPLAFGAYVLGSVPTAYLLVQLLKGIDIRRVGTGNVGALNAYHQIGAWGGSLVLSVDTGKGVLAALAPGWFGAPDWPVFLTTLLVVAGHNWPVFLNFRGGKGAAAIFGVSLAFVPVLTLIVLAPTLLVMLLLRNVVLGAAFGFALLNTMLIVTHQGADQVALCGSLTLVVTATYAVSVRHHISVSIRTRQWRELFAGLA